MIGPRPLDERIASAEGQAFVKLDVGGVNGMGPWRATLNLGRFIVAVPRATVIMRRFRPDVVMVGGGYVCAPVAVASWLLRVPLVTLCVDVAPGWAVRLASRLSTRVVTAFPETLTTLPVAKTHVTGYPVRAEFLEARRDASRVRLGLPRDEKVLLVFGGSLGARAINRALAAALPRLLPVAHVVHVMGGSDAADPGDDASSLPEDLAPRYHRYRFLDAPDMAAALAAADLAVCRAGAATLAELPATGAPAILIPGDFSAQEDNASSMEARGAAAVILDRDLTPARLADVALDLLGDDTRLARMSSASRALAGGDAAGQIAALVREVAHV